MQRRLLIVGTGMSVFSMGALAQNRPSAPPTPAPARIAVENTSVAGKWTYRSYHNRTDLVGDNATNALALLFGEGIMTIDAPTRTTLRGDFDMGNGYVLDLRGTIQHPVQTSPAVVEIIGHGRAGTPTDGWQYDYNAVVAHQWPNGVNQMPALVGTVIRARPHNGAPAGYVASFIAVRQS